MDKILTDERGRFSCRPKRRAMNDNPRIKLTDTLLDATMKIGDGNPGAIHVCAQMLTKGDAIDPDAAMGGVANLLSLDSAGIYGPRVWMLHKDVCGEDLVTTIGLLRGWQLGIVTEAELLHAIDNRGAGIDVSDVLAKVREQLPNFGRPQEAEAVAA